MTAQAQAAQQVKVGDLFPDMPVWQIGADGKRKEHKALTSIVPAAPSTELATPPIFRSRVIVVFGVPSAETPVCSGQHLPSFVKVADQFKKAGVQVFCYATNNVAVLDAWVKKHDESGIIQCYPDPHSILAKKFGLDVISPALGAISKRFALILEQAAEGKYVVKDVQVQADPSTCDVTSGGLLWARVAELYSIKVPTGSVSNSTLVSTAKK
ncbi:MAG TPA: redoxin family protein [Chlamydiales bacterium]|nr:redoxin family protein [Chlamydiales bacterium]